MRKLLNLFVIATLFSTFSSWSPAQEAETKEKVEAKKGVSETLKFVDDQLVMVTPDHWKSVPTKSNFVQHEFRVPAEGEAFARITFSIAGGSVKANIDRWVGQFDNPPKEDVKTETKEIGKAKAHVVDISGTFKESMGGGPFAPGPMKKMENYRMLGAIIELADGRQVFVKATGPKDIIEKNKDAFKKMIDEMKVK